MKSQQDRKLEEDDPPPSYFEIIEKKDGNMKNKSQENINDNNQHNLESRFTTLIRPSAPPLDVEVGHGHGHDNQLLESLKIAVGDLPSSIKFETETNVQDPDNLYFLARDYITNSLIAKGKVGKESGHLTLHRHNTINGTLVFVIKIPVAQADSIAVFYEGLRTFNIYHSNKLIGTMMEPKWYDDFLSSSNQIIFKIDNIYEGLTHYMKFITKEDLVVLKNDNNSSTSVSPLCKIHVPFSKVEPLASSPPFDAILSFPERQTDDTLSNVQKCLCFAIPAVFMTARNVLPPHLQAEALKAKKQSKILRRIGYFCGIIVTIGLIIILLVG